MPEPIKKPLTYLLEYYVLDIIGNLDSSKRIVLERMQPKLEEIYQTDGSWKQILKTVMGFPEDFEQQVRIFWDGYRVAADNQNLPKDPIVFAEKFIDENF